MASSDLPWLGVIVFLTALLFLLTSFSTFRRCRHSQQRLSTPATADVVPIFTPPRTPSSLQRGLDPTLIETFPTFDYSAVKSFNITNGAALECYVCLNEFDAHETLRLIPSCDHAFHVGCIDAWLASNATCPVCRAKLHELTHINEDAHDSVQQHDNVVINIVADDVPPPPRPKLGRNLTWRSMSSGQPRWTIGMMRLAQSKSTGRVAVKKWEIMERFTLRLPEEVRRRIITGKLRPPTTTRGDDVVVSGWRRGGSYGEESTWGKWVSSLTPGFFTRSKSMEPPTLCTAASSDDSVHGA